MGKLTSKRCFGSALAIVAGVALVLPAPGSAAGQTPHAAAKAWDPPRTPDGQPDIQGGVWTTGPDEVLYTGDLETGVADLDARRIQGRPVNYKGGTLIIDPPDGLIPYQPWAAAKRQEIPHGRDGETIGRKLTQRQPVSLRDLSPHTFCLPGAPHVVFNRDFQFIQTPGAVVMAWEWSHAYRVISLDGRPHIAPNVKLVMGDARGHWDGNTLVVETTNLNDWDWLDAAGTFHSDAMSTIERFAFADANTINYQVTVTDPKVFTRPWTAAFAIRRTTPGEELMEHACVEGERGVEGILGKDPRKQR